MADDSVDVKFGATTSDFNSGVDEVKDKLDELQEPADVLQGAFERLGDALAAFIGVETISRIGDAAAHIAELGEQINRVSHMTGLSTDQVQEFQFAVAMTGGDSDNAALSLERLERNMLQATSGSGAAADAFKALGINITDADGNIRPVMDILGDLADKFHGTEDGATKTYYAMALMGRGGASLIPILDEGRDGLDRLRAKLDETQAKMSPDMVKASEDAAHSMTQFKSAMTGLEEAFIDETSWKNFLDLLTGIAEAASKAARAFKEWADTPSITELYANGQGQGKQYPASYPETYGLLDNGPQASYPGDYVPSESTVENGQQQLPNPFTQVQQQAVTSQQSMMTQWESTLDRMLYQDQAFGQQAKTEEEAYWQFRLQEVEKGSDDETAIMKKLYALEAQDQKQAESGMLAAFKSMGTTMENDFQQVINGILQGTQTWEQAEARLFSDMATAFIDAVAKMIEQWLAFEAVTGIFGSSAASALGLTGGPLTKIIGSFDTGSWSLPQSGLAMVHAGEMIIPAQQAGEIRAGTSSIGGGSGGTSVGINMNVSAIDAKSFMNLVNNPNFMAPLARNLQAYLANNPSLRGSY